MATTNFSAGTTVESSWLNDVDAVVYGDGSDAASLQSNQVRYTPAGTGAVATTTQAKLREIPSVADFTGVVLDGSTDNTSAILTGLAANAGLMFTIPPKCIYDRTTLMATMPTDSVLLDLSLVNDFTSAGQTTKRIGIISSDEAVSDTHFSIDSGHHAILTLNNHGTAGSTSATQHKGSLVWAAGQYTLGGLTNRGWRGAAIEQFSKDGTDAFWIHTVRSLAPWVSINGAYEDWAAGQTISGSGVYRRYGSYHYVSTGAGTTGATPPTHTSGTVSDGTVSWTYVDSADRSVVQFDEYGRFLVGSGSTGAATWSHQVSPTDPAGQYRFNGLSYGASKYAQLKLTPTDSGSAASLQPFLRAEDGIGLRIMDSGGSTDIARFSDAGGMLVKEFCSSSSAATDNDATPSVAGIGTLRINYTNPTSITALDDPTDDQIVHLVLQSANITIVHSSTLTLAGSTNLVTPAAWSVISFKRIPASVSGRWIEISRSLK